MLPETDDLLAPPVVLIADDDDVAREAVTEMLERQGMVVEACKDGQAALDRALHGGVDLVLLDVVMPRLGGFECCRLIKAATEEHFLPVVLLTIRSDTESRVEGLRIGADDYVGKPFDERELLARVTGLLHMKRLHDYLAMAKVRLERLAIHDELTGLYNYRYLRTRVHEEFKRAERYEDALACVMIDIDHFKSVNDRHGHDIGDLVLREVAKRLKQGVREVDVVARYGGEEFLLVLPSTYVAGAIKVADRIRETIEKEPIEAGSTTHEITISAGVAAFPNPGIDNKDRLLKAADQALYRAKAEGRNRVCTPPENL